MSKKNKILDGALRYIQNAAGTSNNQPDPDSVLAEYKKYVSKEKVVSYTRSADSNPEELREVAINPFYSELGTGDENKVLVKASKRALEEASVQTVEAVCNIDLTTDEISNEIRKFEPAKATVRNPGASKTFTPTVSQVTGISYRKLNAPSYTFPYGQAAGKIYEGEVRGDILAATQAIANATVTFSPEKRS